MESEFREWAAKARGPLRVTAFMLSGDWYFADDLVQETLTRMFLVWGRVTASGEPDSYARRVLINKFLDAKRRAWRAEVPHERLPDAEGYGTEVDPRHEAVVAALRQVPARQRAALVLRFWDDLSVEQTAQALGCSTGTVKSQTSRGLENLRQALAEQGIHTFREVVGEL
ncbi:MAG: SigE family RNA polymerase sigma factor [Actinobacteria bacterium]|nr:SigE family RNA polymerase sigma factor [Actinomycetota bacterium]